MNNEITQMEEFYDNGKGAYDTMPQINKFLKRNQNIKYLDLKISGNYFILIYSIAIGEHTIGNNQYDKEGKLN